MLAHEPALSRADLWKPFLGGPTIHCYLCAFHCRIVPGDRGHCGVRLNRDGALYTLTYGCPIAAAVDPIEKKPLFHFLPGSLSFSVATVGCNFTCSFCQNADISQMPRAVGRVRGTPFRPEEVVARAMATGCQSVAYTYTEPTIFFEYAHECARQATKAGLKNVFVTNGYMTKQCLDAIGGDLHAANVDLKSFSDEFYRQMVGARLKPVLDTLRRLVERGVWLEVTTLLIPGRNDGEEELRGLAAFLAALDPDIPWHVSRFHPAFRLIDVAATPLSSIKRAVAIGREEGLRYVYAGNLSGQEDESTHCPTCGEIVVERHGRVVERVRLKDDRCPRCGTVIPVIPMREVSP